MGATSQRLMRRFARWHIWLGWIAAIPILLWLASGLFMAARPIEDVRGENLRRMPRAMAATGLTLPHIPGPLTRLQLSEQLGRPVWLVTDSAKNQARFAGESGAPLGPVGAVEAQRLAAAAFVGTSALTGVRKFGAAQAPLDLRKSRPSWQASFADGTHVYIDADTGEVLALRTRFWRAYDFMWGLHIMDPRTRENSSNVLLWLFGSVALVSCLIGGALLFRRRRVAR
ncbi:MAG: hypothetical protein ACKOOL_13560 [Novosphingobium sp.]